MGMKSMTVNGKSVKLFEINGGTWFSRGSPTPPSDDPVLFNGGYIAGIGWSGNLLTRPNYTALGYADLTKAESEGIMILRIDAGTSISYNAHVCTSNKINIPSTATVLKVRALRQTSSAIMKFGLLGDGYVNACIGTGGVMSAAQYPTGVFADYTLQLPAGFAGTSDYRAVINIQDTAAAARVLQIQKVWFE